MFFSIRLLIMIHQSREPSPLPSLSSLTYTCFPLYSRHYPPRPLLVRPCGGSDLSCDSHSQARPSSLQLCWFATFSSTLREEVNNSINTLKHHNHNHKHTHWSVPLEVGTLIKSKYLLYCISKYSGKERFSWNGDELSSVRKIWREEKRKGYYNN